MAKVALVTGAGSGIGEAVARALSESGSSLALTGRRLDALEQTAAGLNKDTLVVTADVGNAADVKDLFARVAEKYGRLLAD